MFPVLFPVRSKSWRNGFLKFPVFRISSVTAIDPVISAIHIVEEQGTLGTGQYEASPGTNSGSTRLRHASLNFFEYVMCSNPLLPSLFRTVRRAEWVSGMGYPIVTVVAVWPSSRNIAGCIHRSARVRYREPAVGFHVEVDWGTTVVVCRTFCNSLLEIPTVSGGRAFLKTPAEPASGTKRTFGAEASRLSTTIYLKTSAGVCARGPGSRSDVWRSIEGRKTSAERPVLSEEVLYGKPET